MREKLAAVNLFISHNQFLILSICTNLLIALLISAAAYSRGSDAGNYNALFRPITGVIVSSAGGTAISGATVQVKGSPKGTSTDASGRFEIDANDGDTIVVSAIGYAGAEIPVTSSSSYSIQLQPSGTELGEVVVTALGIRKEKRKLGFSVTELKGSELAQTNEINPVNALQGKVAGVQIDQGAGGVFGNTKILIRGNSTLNKNNQPIFVIDGVILDNDINEIGGRSFGNDLKNLNMEDFESVSVLKGSAAAALYGARAINGVILITTKKGRKRDGLGVSFTQTYNIYKPYRGPDFQNEFGGGTVGAFFTDNRDPNYGPNDAWRTKVFPIDPSSGQPYIDRQIFRELENWGPRMEGQEVINYDGTVTRYLPQPDNFLDAFQTGKGLMTNIALDGGTDKSTFRVSFTHNQSEGIIPGNELSKNGFNFRGTHIFNKIFSADVSGDYTVSNSYNPPNLSSQDAFASNNFGKAFAWVFPRNYDTKYWMQREKYIGAFGGVPNPNDPNEPNKVPNADFWFTLFENRYEQQEQMVRGRIALTADVTSWLKLVLEGNINNIYKRNEVKELGKGYGFTGNGNYEGGFYSNSNTTKNTGFLKWMALVTHPINQDIDFSGYVGGELQQTKISFTSGATDGGLNYPGNYFLTNSKLPAITRGGIAYNKRFNSLYASADLSYREQLYLQATWRGDWSSALTYSDGSGNNFYNYPAVSVSWLVSQTFNLPSVISYAKVRANIAALGKDTDPFILNPGFAFSGILNYGGQSVPLSTFSSPSALQPDIKPERKIAKEIGLEMRFLNSRAGFDISLYRDNTRNQILPITVPFESGVTSILVNAGNIQNTGIEANVFGSPVKTSNFEWSSNFNIAANRNKIVSLHPDLKEFPLGVDVFEVSTWAVEGGSYGVIRSRIESLKFQDKDANDNPIDNPRNGLPVLSWRSDARAAFPARSNTLQDIGDINPKFRAGWENTFRYKSLSLSILLDAKMGGDMILASYRLGTHTGALANTLFGRDPEHGGITWTSAYDNQTYDDGIIVQGVFAPGQMITQPDGSQVDVGGMTFQEAYDQGFVEPTHAPQFYYRNGSSSTGVADLMVWKNSWIAIRQVSINYQLPQALYRKLRLNGASIGITGRDLGYLHNSLPLNFNPASNISNSTASQGEYGFLPMVRNFIVTLRVNL